MNRTELLAAFGGLPIITVTLKSGTQYQVEHDVVEAAANGGSVYGYRINAAPRFCHNMNGEVRWFLINSIKSISHKLAN